VGFSNKIPTIIKITPTIMSVFPSIISIAASFQWPFVAFNYLAPQSRYQKPPILQYHTFSAKFFFQKYEYADFVK
jgi:hypothetical protein